MPGVESMLTQGALKVLMDGGTVSKPVLQVLNHKPVPSTTSGERHRLLLSDGINLCGSAMLATQLNEHIRNGNLNVNNIIRLDNFLVNQINDEKAPNGTKRVLIILELSLVKVHNEKIGNPQTYNATSNANNVGRPQMQTQASAPSFNGHQNSTGSSFGGSGFGNPNERSVFPITALTPYVNRWCIRARIINKSTIRTWSNARGEGKLFSVDLLDESGEIRATAFNDQCDRYYNLLEVNKLFYISRGTLKPANKAFTSIKNDFELTFNSETQVEPCLDKVDMPTIQYDFVPIDSIQGKDAATTIDVIGICKHMSDMQVIVSQKTNRELKKRDIQLVDKTNTEVTLTLWGDQAEQFTADGNPVIALKGARISEFNGRSLNTVSGTMMLLNPDIREAHALRGWYDREGNTASTVSISQGSAGGRGGSNIWKSIGEAKAESLGSGDKPDYYTMKGSIVLVRKDNSLYQACPEETCNKKLLESGTNEYRCEKCNRDFDTFKWRMMLSVNVADYSGSQWVTCFQETGASILGIDAQELGELKKSDEKAFDRVFETATFKSHLFRIRCKTETFNDESRLKSTVMAVNPLDLLEYNRKLIADIKQMMG